MPGVAKGISRSWYFLLLLESLSQKPIVQQLYHRCIAGALQVADALQVNCRCIAGALKVYQISLCRHHWTESLFSLVLFSDKECSNFNRLQLRSPFCPCALSLRHMDVQYLFGIIKSLCLEPCVDGVGKSVLIDDYTFSSTYFKVLNSNGIL